MGDILFICAAIGLGVLLGATNVWDSRDDHWKRETIGHGCATYTTEGEFQWLTGAQP